VAPGAPGGGAFPNNGRAFRRTATGEFVPYYDRGQIEDGALDGQHLEICWLRDPADALAVQIEGSARVRLEDGAVLRINYDAHNGYPFVPAGRVLIEHHLVTRKEMSTQRTAEWMRDNPEGAQLKAQWVAAFGQRQSTTTRADTCLSRVFCALPKRLNDRSAPQGFKRKSDGESN
jgi:hypothetical protein